VAVFRPVSKAASSLAEQMKGRAARPLKNLIEGLQTPQQRKDAIAASDKPDALIIDLVGITGLSETCSTIEIYAEGMRDDIKERAQQLMLDGEEDVQQALDDAQEQVEQEERQRQQEEREREEYIRREAARRAAAGATAKYTEHEMGHGSDGSSDLASEKQVRFLAFLGFQCVGWEPSRRQARQLITLLKEKGLSPEQAAAALGLEEYDWDRTEATNKQKYLMTKRGIRWEPGITPVEASELIERSMRGGAPSVYWIKDAIKRAQSGSELDQVGKQMVKYRGEYRENEWTEMVEAGKQRRRIIQDDF
jgi:hypothetical protein